MREIMDVLETYITPEKLSESQKKCPKYLFYLWAGCLESNEEEHKLKKFFDTQLLSQDYWLIIYMDRRCSSLLRTYPATSEKCDIMIVSHNALPGMFHMLKDYQKAGTKKILVADDILIHGRTIQSVWNYLTNICGIPADKIDIDIYGYCISPPKCLTEQVKRRILPMRMLGQSAWRNLSNQFLAIVLKSGLPHASFVMSYGKYLSHSTVNISSLPMKDVVSVDLSSEDLERVVWLPQHHSLNELVAACCMRAVYSRQTSRLSLIPFVITNPVRRDRLPSLFKSLANHLPKSCENLRNAFAYSCLPNIEELDSWNVANTALEEYKMRLLNCILSVWFGAVFRREFFDNSVVPLEIDVDILKYSFSVPIANDIAKLEQAAFNGWEWRDCKEINSCLFQQGEDRYINDDSDKLYVLLDEALERNKSTPQWLWYDFFARVGEEDDVRAEKNLGRLLGLPSTYLKKITNGLDSLLAYLTDAWDQGAAALTYRSIGDVCQTYNTAGEQSFQYYQKRYGLQIEGIRQAANTVWEESDWQKESIEHFRKKQYSAMNRYVLNQTEDTRISLMHFLEIYGKEISCWPTTIP